MLKGANFQKSAPPGLASAALAVLTISSVIFSGALRADESVNARAEAGERQIARPLAREALLEQNDDKAKLVFVLSAPVDAASFVLSGPDRVIVDLPQIDFAIDPEAGKLSKRRLRRSDPQQWSSLIDSFRFGQLGQGKSRIILELNSPARIVRAICDSSGEGTGPRLVIELARTDRASFRAAVESARSARADQAKAAKAEPFEAAAATTSKPVVMIDPGHGGIDSGAMVNGLVEKDLVFDFARMLADKLRADPRFTTVLTRTDDSFIPLSDRVKMARGANAALFVSIHADILSEAADVAGATVYTVSDRASDAEAARVAEKENQSDAQAGIEGAEEASGVSDILFDLTRRETRAYSHVFARTLTNYWKVAGRLNKNPQRSAGFRVLKAPDVPSVLLELGYLSNRKDDASLSSAEWRDKAAGRVAEAIAAFFDSKESPTASIPAEKDWTPVGKVDKDVSNSDGQAPPGAVTGATVGGGRRDVQAGASH
ncbi:N-acetylmuramoyl-L-alanine amidase [Methylocapsa palsarum]|uniref:N-acetylmuramoyl-L-alanine amidase n=1 Tax=Methylocapsa palsarum TaxID=1612308 RepID=A0A1I3ZS86_9HYPH|nr:N-acetylmuramoyl-L-alanine amidase [Methylocapsa palsarum]SFK46955.1 N-acetylmuramoyl-L-alanine amidase [Methylocapsa palsarum]